MLAATAVTVTVGKKTAIAGGKATLIYCIAYILFHPSLCLNIHILKVASLITRVKHLVFPYSWLFLLSICLSV